MKNGIISALIAATMLSGCVTDQAGQEGPTKQIMGTILGGISGAVLGSKMGSGKGKLAAIALGALAGAWAGSEIGASLDRADKMAIEQESVRALASVQDGQTVIWRNPDSGVSAKITPTNSRVEQRQMTIVRDKRVTPAPRLVLVGETYEAKKNANLRAAPSTSHEIVGSLQAGEAFHAVGRVQDSDWVLVSKDNRSVGYVYGLLVQPAAVKNEPELRKAVNLDEIELNQNVVADQVTVEAKCRTINYDVTTKDGQTGHENFEACKGSGGAWEIL